MKVCKKCGFAKALTDFNKAPSNADGIRNDCKLCQADYLAAHYEKNKTKHKAASKAWRAANREAAHAISRRHYEKNKDEICEKNKLWNTNNPESLRAANRRYAPKKIERLTNSYVRRLLGAKKEEIPLELIDTKRQQLLLKRLSLQLKYAAKESYESKPEHS